MSTEVTCLVTFSALTIGFLALSFSLDGMMGRSWTKRYIDPFSKLMGSCVILVVVTYCLGVVTKLLCLCFMRGWSVL